MSRSSISGVPAEPDADEQAQDVVLRVFLSTAQHFFGGFSTLPYLWVFSGPFLNVYSVKFAPSADFSAGYEAKVTFVGRKTHR